MKQGRLAVQWLVTLLILLVFLIAATILYGVLSARGDGLIAQFLGVFG